MADGEDRPTAELQALIKEIDEFSDPAGALRALQEATGDDPALYNVHDGMREHVNERVSHVEHVLLNPDEIDMHAHVLADEMVRILEEDLDELEDRHPHLRPRKDRFEESLRDAASDNLLEDLKGVAAAEIEAIRTEVQRQYGPEERSPRFPDADVHPSAYVHESVKIAPGVRVGPGAWLDEGVEVEAGAVIEAEAFVGDYVRIGPRARVGRKAKVRAGTKVGPGASVAPEAIVDEDCTIEADAHVEYGTDYGETVRKAGTQARETAALAR